MTTVNITSLPNIGNLLTSNSILPIVSTVGTATTDKTTVGALANYILVQTGNLLPPARQALTSQTVTNAAQPNITSLGTLNELFVSGNATLGNANQVMIHGGNNGAFLQTDGTGNLTWAAPGSGNGSPGGSNTQVQFNDNGVLRGTSALTFNKDTNIFTTTNIVATSITGPLNGTAFLATQVTTGAQPNITSVGTLGNVVVSGNANVGILKVSGTSDLGAVGNVTITGGSNGQVLTTNGSNVLSWTTVSGGNSNYGNSDVANYLPTFTGNIGANIVTANLFSGSGANLTNIAGANVSGFVANANIANTAFSVAGANVSGFVANANIANTAFAVAAANVSGLGNIATTNYDGNASNVLHGNGTWSAGATTYDNSNVVTLLSAFGSNTISTTGNISVGNITATNLGNIATLNLDGNVSNLLTGNGTYAAIPVVPTVGNIATLNLDGNVSNLLTGNGTYAAIPVVPTVGNIATLNLNGSSSNVLYGNGIFAAVAGGSSIVTTGYNVGANTVVLAGAIKVRYNGIGDIELQATSGTIGAYWTGQYITASTSFTLESSRSLNTSVWWAIGANVGSTGDTIIITLMDTTNGKIYRVTTIITPTGNCGSIMIETLI